MRWPIVILLVGFQAGCLGSGGGSGSGGDAGDAGLPAPLSETPKAVSFLHSMQRSDGSFDLSGAAEGHSSGINALALLALLSQEGLSEPVVRGVKRLLSVQDDRGLFRRGVSGADGKPMIEVGYVLTLFLEIELQRQSGRIALDPTLDNSLKGAIALSLDFILKTQDASGIWPYNPTGSAWHDQYKESATWVSIVEALLLAMDAGFNVPQPVLDRALQYIRKQQKDGGFINGQIESVPSPHVSRGVLAPLYMIDQHIGVGDLIGPARGFVASWDQKGYLDSIQLDIYGLTGGIALRRHLYGFLYTLLFLRRSGDGAEFDRVYEKIKKTLMANQGKDGSWVASIGTVGATAAAVLALNSFQPSRLALYRGPNQPYAW